MFAYKVNKQYFDHCQQYICKWIMKAYTYRKWVMIVQLLPSSQKKFRWEFYRNEWKCSSQNGHLKKTPSVFVTTKIRHSGLF